MKLRLPTKTNIAIAKQRAIWRMERMYQERYARRHGYFWSTCELCGEEFGGHENGSGTVPTTKPDLFRSICPFCTAVRHDEMERILRDNGIGGSYSGSHSHFPHQYGGRLGADFEPLDR